jgi:hypothetical protein
MQSKCIMHKWLEFKIEHVSFFELPLDLFLSIIFLFLLMPELDFPLASLASAAFVGGSPGQVIQGCDVSPLSKDD